MYIHYRSYKLMTQYVRIITRILWMWTEIETKHLNINRKVKLKML